MTNVVQYRGDTTNRGNSATIWYDCPWLEIFSGTVDGTLLYDNFDTGGLITAPTTIAALGGGVPWSGFSSGASQVTHDDASGIVLAETTVNEATNIFQNQHPFFISSTSGGLWFEARIKLSHTATTENSWFVGLMDTTTTTATVPLTATGALADANLIGFHKPEANTTAFDASHKADGQTVVEDNSDIGTIVAATYFKVGFKHNADTDLVSYYVDGVEQANTVSSATATTFPNAAGDALGVVIALAVGAAESDNTLTCDWIRVAHVY